MIKTGSFDMNYPKPVDAKDTELLSEGAKEPQSFQSGDNVIERDTTKHKPFGGLGGRGFADDK